MRTAVAGGAETPRAASAPDGPAASRRTTPEHAAIAAAGGLLAAAAFAGDSALAVGVVAVALALAAAAPTLAGRARRPTASRAGVAAGALGAAFVLWNGLSILWSALPDRSWHYVTLGLVYTAFAVAGALFGGLVPRAPRAAAAALALVLGAVVVWSLAGKVFPGLYPDYERVARLRGPVGYWNALALLGDFAIPLGLWAATRTRARVAGVLLVYGWTLAILLALSRGGVLVAVAVGAVWLAVDERRLESAGALVLAVVPAALVALAASPLDGITTDGSSAALRAYDGRIFGAVVVGVACAVAAVAAAAARAGWTAPRRRAAARAAVAVAALVAAAAVVGVAANAERFWHDFSAQSPVSQGAGRIGSTGSNFRLTWWKQAARGFADHPVVGTGAGSFEYTNLRLRHFNVDRTLEPHDLPLQFLTETGVVGFLLWAGALAAAAVAVVRRVRADDDRPAALALALVPLAYVLHGLLDYDWDFVAVTGPALFATGVLLTRPGRRPARSWLGAVAAVAGAAAIVSSLLLPWLAQRRILAAYGESPRRVIALARDARALDPYAVEAYFQEAEAQASLGNLPRAWQLYAAAAARQPDNKETWFRLGEFELHTLDRPQLAYPHLLRFVQLDPQGPGGEVYHEALDRVNAGAKQ